MSAVVLLDAGPLGRLTNPKDTPENERCRRWLARLARQNVRAVIAEIADYEVRRELLRAVKPVGLARLDAFRGLVD